MKMIVYINKLNNKVIINKTNDHHDNVVKLWIDFLMLRYFVENEEKF